MKHSFLFVGIILLFLIAACSPSPEQIATMTALAWIPTPVPPTSTPSPTPAPYDLTVKVKDSGGNPIVGVSVIFPESGNLGSVIINDSGQLSWNNLEGPRGSLTVSAQGYLNAEQAINLERGSNEVVIILERDPYGLLPSTACATGENLLYMEDFQDGQTDMAYTDYTASGVSAPVPLGSAIDEVGNTVLIHDSTTTIFDPNTNGPYATSLLQNSEGEFYGFGDAVLRFRFMMTQQTSWPLLWNLNYGHLTEFGGIMTTMTGYRIGFYTNPDEINVSRYIVDDSYKRVHNMGKMSFLNQVLILNPNIWHYMEISIYQGHLQIWLDGVSVEDVQDDLPLPPGGFQIFGGESGIIYYDALSVCGLSKPFTSIPAPVPVSP